jgi:SAM-dependent methyltransferase
MIAIGFSEGASSMPLTCPGCRNSEGTKRLETAGQYTLYVCAACELTFSDPMQAADSDFYEANSEYDDKWEFAFLQGKMQQLGLKGSLLDIGCGDGRFMESMKAQFVVTGLDINRCAVRKAELERRLADVHPIKLEEFRAKFPDRKYDVVTFFHVLEHVEDSNKFLSELKQCLKPGGIVAGSVPNPDRWTLRWIREVWDYPPHHLTRWTRHSLCALLEGQGFAVMEVYTEKINAPGQAKNAIRDILWAIVFKKFRFGVASRLEARIEKIDSSKRKDFCSSARVSLLAVVRSMLVKLKGKAIYLLSFLLTWVLYPILWMGGYEGRSLLVLAKLKEQVPDRT